MLIKALCDYYDVLEKQGKVSAEAYSEVEISYLISLTTDGRLDGIVDCRTTEVVEQKGKTKEIKVKKKTVLPKRTEKPGIDGNVIEHRPLYIFGLNYDAQSKTFTPDDKTQKARKSHDAFVKQNGDFFADLEEPVCKAYRRFVETWEPEKEIDNPFLSSLGKDALSSYYGFCLSGHPEITLHECAAVKAKWETAFAKRKADGGESTAQCAILGEMLPIARIHEKITGVPGGKSMGNVLINFNNPSEESYGREQSFNSNVSEAAMHKYCEALNKLMSDRRHRNMLDDVVVLHWAASGNDACDDLFADLVFSETYDADKTDRLLQTLMQNAASGRLLTNVDGFYEKLDPDVTFYIVGFKPNSSRLAVKFFYRRRFGDIVDNLVRHQTDMQTSDKPHPVSFARIKRELISPKSSNETLDPSVGAKLLDAAVYGRPYAQSLYQTVLRRIRTDHDVSADSESVRMGLLKACINRKDRLNGKKEEITLSLDTTNRDPAYLCGRLFAELENIQRRALGKDLNRTIKDAYFSSASLRPALVFPRLLALAQHHLDKIESRRADDAVKEIMDALGSSFPTTLSLTEQGVFMLGYYQQNKYREAQITAYKESKGE